jgi:hypothetical protein
MKTKRRATQAVAQVHLDTDKLVDAIVTKLVPFLVGKAEAYRDAVTGQGLDEFCASMGISRSKAKKEIAEGRLKPCKVGRKVLITSQAKADWIASLPASTSIKQSDAAYHIRHAAKSERSGSK